MVQSVFVFCTLQFERPKHMQFRYRVYKYILKCGPKITPENINAINFMALISQRMDDSDN